MRRGEIWLADLGEGVGRELASVRPVLLVNAQEWLDSRPHVVTTLPFSRTQRDVEADIRVEPGLSGLREAGYVHCDHVRPLSPERLEQRLGSMDEETMQQVTTLMRRSLGL